MIKILYASIVFCLVSNFTFAQNNTGVYKEKFNKNNPININSEEATVIKNQNKIIFKKNVKAKQDNFLLYSDIATVKYNENGNEKFAINSIKTDGHVKFISTKIVATGETGYYDVINNTVTLENNVDIIQNGISINAEKFEYFVKTGKTNITGSKIEKNKKQVTVILDNSVSK